LKAKKKVGLGLVKMFVTRHPPHPPRGQPSWDTTLTVDLPNSNVTLPNRFNLIRLLMAEAALQADVLPRQLSFKHTLQIWVAWSQRQFLSTADEDTATLLILIAQIRVADRPGRIEPRAVKRRPKPYPRLDRPRQQARMEIAKYGHAKKLQA